MKVKMIKMGRDIDETRNHRIRGIIPTKDGKYLFMEILQGYRPNRCNTLLAKKEYELKYPNSEYIMVDSCFRVDIPQEYSDNYSPEFKDMDRKSYYKLAYTKENIVKLLQKLNKDIEDIELVNENYIDKFCEEKGFFKLYDKRLKHFYKPLEIIWFDLEKNGVAIVKCLYIYYAANGTEYSNQLVIKTTISELIKENGKEFIEKLVNAYIEKIYPKITKPELRERYLKVIQEMFKNNANNLELENELNL